MLKKYYHLVIPVAVSALCALLFLSSLDGKVYDMYLRTIPSLREDNRVLLITVDDGALENVGLFPWTRDIYADFIVFLREMGAETVAFDLSFLDNSPVRVDAAYVREDLPRYIEEDFSRINSTVSEVLDGISTGYYSKDDTEMLKSDLVDYNNSVRQEMEVNINYVIRDVDAYFADTLKFFDDSFLTLTMINEEAILGDDKTWYMDPEVQSFLEQNIAIKDIVVDGDTKTPENPGITPAILKLLRKARGAGFVNALPDSDGYRRRVHLLMKHHGHYYPHLTLAAMKKRLDYQGIEVNNAAIILKNALTDGGRRDIRIPRAEDGSVLVNWPKKSFYEYNTMSSWDLIQYTRLETKFIQDYLRLMQDSYFFDYWDGDKTPLQLYNDSAFIREGLYSGENPAEGISFDAYMDARHAYLEASDSFLNGSYEEIILSDVAGDEQISEFVSSLFHESRLQFAELVKIRDQVSKRTEGALCIVGATMTSSTDLGLITFMTNYPNVGTYAAVSNMLLSGQFLDDTPSFISLILALILSLALAFVVKRLDVGKSILAGLIAMALTVFVFTIFFMITKRYLAMVIPFAAVTLTFLSLTGLNFFSTIREKSFLRSAFSRYLAPEVINQIIADPSKLNLGGEKREMTAIFTDIQSFSSFSEKFDPADLVALLNLYLTEMSNIVMENGGTIDKFEGDAIIAFFGAPIPVETHAALACRSAIRMKRAEIGLREKIMDPQGPFSTALADLIAQGKLRPESPIYTRIGINTGDMVVGNMGTPNKMDYTIMGNAVNLAARLEGVNKQYNTGGMLISEYTRAKIGDEFLVRSLDRVRVVGISTPLRLYELLDIRQEAPAELSAMVGSWESGIQAYESRNFREAAGIFSAIVTENGKDACAKLYLNRCRTLIDNPPEAEWDAVNNLTQK
ncbi:MAG: adenylate/guanylate cyclase domain-containing protein [Treponema sp.]|jgi:adenylate cyclase|nr:adenylate/guanylate cyclase domain-containing protein [Treponema sp.]